MHYFDKIDRIFGHWFGNLDAILKSFSPVSLSISSLILPHARRSHESTQKSSITSKPCPLSRSMMVYVRGDCCRSDRNRLQSTDVGRRGLPAVAENWVQTTVDSWTFHVMVKASELLEHFDVVLVVNSHNDPALLI